MAWGGGPSVCRGLPRCVLVVGMAEIQRAAPVAGQHGLIRWDRQSMASPRW